MNNADIIAHASDLIDEFDPTLAILFRTQPFQRHNIVSALHHSLSKSKHAGMADRIAVTLRTVIDSTKEPKS